MSVEELCELGRRVKARHDTLRLNIEASEWAAGMERSEKRARHGDYSDRATERGSVFARLNVNLPVVPLVSRFIRARMSKDIFGSSPWYDVRPEGVEDIELAETLKRYSGWRLSRANLREFMRGTGLNDILDFGQCFVLCTYDRSVERIDEWTSVLADGSGQPYRAPDGSYFTAQDEMIEREGADGEIVMAFAKDPDLMPDVESTWVDALVERDQTSHDGLRFERIHWRDFVWPMTVDSLDRADLVARRYQKRLTELRGWLDRADDPMTPYQREAMAKLETETASAKSAERQPTVEESDDAGATPDEDPVIELIDAWVCGDILGDGSRRRAQVTIAAATEEILDCRYLSETTPDGCLPVHCIAIDRMPGRVYGRGLYRRYDELADLIDRMVCGIILRNASHANPTNFVRRNSVIQWAGNNRPIDIECGKTYELAHGAEGNVIETFTLPDLDSRTWSLFELFMQMITLDAGYSNAGGGAVSGLPTTDLATGINSMLESASVLHFELLDDIRDGLGKLIGQAIGMDMMYQDEDVTRTYFEGGEAAQQVMTMANARRLSRMRMDVEILVTRARRLEQREGSMGSIPIVTDYLNQPPQIQQRLRELVIQALKSFDIDHPERMVPAPVEPQPEPHTGMVASEGIGGVEQEPDKAFMGPAQPVNVIDDDDEKKESGESHEGQPAQYR